MGAKMNGEFAMSAAGVAGYGGSIARESMKKARKAGEKSGEGAHGQSVVGQMVKSRPQTQKKSRDEK